MRRLALALLTAASPASAAWAQASSPPPTSPPAASAEEEIVVVAQSDQRTSIDRETYVVRDTAQARTSNALDILGRIPAITVQPDNSIRLLGTTGVTILVDGRPSPNPNILRDLQGSEIARIEVVSNPSAQFSASGTAGVINIITRRNAFDGLRGSVTASASRYGGFELRAAPSWTSGDWTISGGLGWTHNDSESEGSRERISLDPTSPVPDTIETQQFSNRYEFVNAWGQISHRLTEKRTLTLQGGLGGSRSRFSTASQLLFVPAAGGPLAQLTTGNYDYGSHNVAAEYRAESHRPGELLTTSVQTYRYDPTNQVITESAAGVFRSDSESVASARLFKLDYVRPLRPRHRLLVGGAVTDRHDRTRAEQGGEQPFGGNPFPPISIVDGSFLEAATYASYQFPFLGGTLLGGLRAEGRDYDFADPALGEGPSDVYFFPSLHLERSVASWLTGNISYSRRIAWPAIQQLSPTLQFFDATTAYGGNPALRPELTNSIEARLRAQVRRQSISLSMFGRQTDDLYSTLSTQTDDGVLLSRPVNVGERTDLGVSVALQGAIVRGLSYTLNANLIDRQVKREDFGLLRVQKSTTYSSNLQFDYRDGMDGKRGADRVTVNANFSGPYDDGLVRQSSYFRVNASWSHAVTDRLSTIVTVDDVFGPTEFRSTNVSGSTLSRYSTFSDGPRYKLSLTYSLGRPGQPQPPVPAAPAVPVPAGP